MINANVTINELADLFMATSIFVHKFNNCNSIILTIHGNLSFSLQIYSNRHDWVVTKLLWRDLSDDKNCAIGYPYNVISTADVMENVNDNVKDFIIFNLDLFT